MHAVHVPKNAKSTTTKCAKNAQKNAENVKQNVERLRLKFLTTRLLANDKLVACSKTYFMMNDCCGGMGVMMWIFMLLGIVALVALIVWIVKQSKK
ncbi:hypothetical protein BH20BAC1_BH20BAC1_19850 [soil metagenome]|jgi:hypothetical protein